MYRVGKVNMNTLVRNSRFFYYLFISKDFLKTKISKTEKNVSLIAFKTINFTYLQYGSEFIWIIISKVTEIFLNINLLYFFFNFIFVT